MFEGIEKTFGGLPSPKQFAKRHMIRSIKGLHRASIRQLQMIISVAECGTMVGAAERVNLTQPAVTKAVRELEHDLGVKLFERSNRGVTPTVYGEVLVRRARMVMSQLAQASEEIEGLSTGMGGRVVVGTLLAGAAWLVPVSAGRLRERRSGVQVSIVEGTNERLIPMLLHGELDFIVGRLSEIRYTDGLTQEALYDENMILVARPGHPLDDGKVKTTRDLVDCEWILPPGDTTLRRQIDQAFLADGLEPPNVVVDSVSLQANRVLLRSTDLVCVLPETVVADDIAEGTLIQIPTRKQRGTGPVGVSTRAEQDLSPTADAFLAILREVAKEHRDGSQ
jgi:DNA-binding transcriptional LysR family regulator